MHPPPCGPSGQPHAVPWILCTSIPMYTFHRLQIPTPTSSRTEIKCCSAKPWTHTQAMEEEKVCILKLKLLFSKTDSTVKWLFSLLELALGGGCLPAPLGLCISLPYQCLSPTSPAPAALDGPESLHWPPAPALCSYHPQFSLLKSQGSLISLWVNFLSPCSFWTPRPWLPFSDGYFHQDALPRSLLHLHRAAEACMAIPFFLAELSNHHSS